MNENEWDIKNYCWNCKIETLQHPVNFPSGISKCTICQYNNWTEDYPIGDDEIPQNSLIASHQQYQIEKRRYYQEKGASTNG